LVIITYNNIPDTLKYDPFIEPITGKFYNYTSSQIVPADYTSEFYLRVEDRKGRKATGKTVIMPPVPIDTVEFRFNDKEEAFPLTRFKDDPSIVNYYRYTVIDPDTTPREQV